MIFKLNEEIYNLYRSIKNTDSLTRKELGSWITNEYNNLPKELLQTKYENEIPNACLKLIYIYMNTQILKLTDFEYQNISNEDMLECVIRIICEHFKYPSIMSKWFVILFEEMGLQQYYSIKFNYNDYEDHLIDIDNFIIHILKWNLNPAYFGTFIEQVIAYALGGHIRNIKEGNFNDIELFKINMLFSKVVKNTTLCEEFYYNINCKSIYHYFAFTSLFSNSNFEDYLDSYNLLIERLDTDFIKRELEKYLQNLFTNKEIASLFDLSNRNEYQKEVKKNDIHGYIDIITPYSIIDIKAYNNVLKNINENSSTIIQWYFQIYLYNHCINTHKDYIVFNPITNIIRVWRKPI